MTASGESPDESWSPDRIAAALDLVRDGIVVLDADDLVALANAPALERFGRDQSDVVGRSLFELVPGLADTDFPAYLAAVRENTGSIAIDQFVGAFSGWFEIKADARGSDVIISVREVTGQRRMDMERDLIARIDELVPGSSTMTETISTVARVLRTGLGCELAEVWMHRDRNSDVRLVAVDHDPDRSDVRAFVSATGDSTAGDGTPPVRAVTADSVVITTDPTTDPTFVRRGAAARAGFRCALHVGVPVAGGLTLVFGLFRSDRAGLDDGAAVLGLVRDHLGTVIARRRAQLELEQFFSLAHEFVAITGLRGGFRRVNPAMAAGLGFSESELLQLGFGSLVHPDDIDSSTEAINRMVETGVPAAGFENRVLTATGEHRWISWNAQVFAEEGVVFSTGRDVTDERAERLQREHQNEALRSLLAGEPLGDVLDRVVRMVEAQDPSLTCSVLLSESSGRPMPEASSWSVPVRAPDGEVLGMLVVASRRAGALTERQRALTDAAVQLAGVAIQRHRAETAARTSEERFRLLSEVVTDAIWDWDIVAGTRWRSESFFTLFGYDPLDIDESDSWWLEHVHPDDRDHVVEGRRRALDGLDDHWTASYRFRCADGRFADVAARGRIVRNAHGQPVRMVGGMTDLSERRQLERQYLRAQRVESLGTLAGGIAHDLNNTLMPISMAVELLQHADLDDEALEVLDVIATSARRSADLVRSILAFARGLDGETEILEIDDVVEQSVRFIRDTFPKDIDVTMDLSTGGVQVRGDATQLHQVVMNLALNARDAMPNGGQLSISADVVVLDQDELTAVRADPAGGMAEVPAGRYARVRVRDTGTGMTAAVRDRLFEPFFTTKPRTEGTGLGLPTALAIARGHGGGIAVTVDETSGVTFDVHLAAELDVVDTGAGDRGPTDAQRRHGDGSMVLVVDDEPVLRSVIRDVLEAHGYRVAVASSGDEALRIHQEHAGEISVVLTDVMMPVMDGVQFVDRLAEVIPGLPVVAMTGLDDAQRAASLLSNGVHAVLRKPFDSDVLLTTLAAARDLEEVLGEGG